MRVLVIGGFLLVMLCYCTEPTTNQSKRLGVNSTENCIEPAFNMITPEMACSYIARQVNDSSLYSFTVTYGCGGFFPIAGDSNLTNLTSQTISFPLPSPYPGFTFIPGIDTKTETPRLMISYCAEKICPDSIPSPLVVSNSIVYHRNTKWLNALPDNLTDSLSVLNYLTQTFEIKLDNDVALLSDSSEVQSSHNGYMSTLSGNSHYADYGYGFVHKSALSNFLVQKVGNEKSVIGFCVFLGFNPSNAIEKNRLVFIAVDNTGKLVLDKDHLCLEKTFPPKD